MGRFVYGFPELSCEFDDRTLAHLAVVIIDKLRRGEAFSFSIQGGVGPTTVWVSLSLPVRFVFDDSERIRINRDWVRALERAARTAHGLRVVAEPSARPPVKTASQPRNSPTRYRQDGEAIRPGVRSRSDAVGR